MMLVQAQARARVAEQEGRARCGALQFLGQGRDSGQAQTQPNQQTPRRSVLPRSARLPASPPARAVFHPAAIARPAPANSRPSGGPRPPTSVHTTSRILRLLGVMSMGWTEGCRRGWMDATEIHMSASMDGRHDVRP